MDFLSFATQSPLGRITVHVVVSLLAYGALAFWLKTQARLSRVQYFLRLVWICLLWFLGPVVAQLATHFGVWFGLSVNLFLLAGIGAAVAYCGVLRANDGFGRPEWGFLALIPLVQLVLLFKPAYDRPARSDAESGETLRVVMLIIGVPVLALLAFLLAVTALDRLIQRYPPSYDDLTVNQLMDLEINALKGSLPMPAGAFLALTGARKQDGALVFSFAPLFDGAERFTRSDTMLKGYATNFCGFPSMQRLLQQGAVVRFEETATVTSPEVVSQITLTTADCP